MSTSNTPISFAQIQQFKIDGYLIVPGALKSSELDQLRSLTEQHLAERREPFELETDVQYPGGPQSIEDEGGLTIRRLLHAYQRDSALQAIAQRSDIVTSVQQILGSDNLLLNPNHHNCIMTKQPAFSSETLWHRDTRYWRFNNKYLVNAWFALGDEKLENGAMKILPGSHRWEVQDDALNEAQFLKLDHPFNQDRLATQRLVSLNAGDLLLFSAHCFHAAGKNTTQSPKFSLVFTYHSNETHGISGRSIAQPAIKIV